MHFDEKINWARGEGQISLIFLVEERQRRAHAEGPFGQLAVQPLWAGVPPSVQPPAPHEDPHVDPGGEEEVALRVLRGEVRLAAPPQATRRNCPSETLQAEKVPAKVQLRPEDQQAGHYFLGWSILHSILAFFTQILSELEFGGLLFTLKKPSQIFPHLVPVFLI